MARIAQYLRYMLLLAAVLILVTACGPTQSGASQDGAIAGPRAAGLTKATVTVTSTPRPKAKPTKPAAKPTTGANNPTNQPQGAATPAVPLPNPNTIVPTPTAVPAQAVFNLINQERASQGKPALTWNPNLIQSAHTHNLAMAAANKLSHQLPGEPNFGTRERNAGVNWMSAAENIGYSSGGDATTQAVNLNKSMFAEQPPDDGHRVNILSSNTNIGIDVYVDAKGQVWLTEDFAGF